MDFKPQIFKPKLPGRPPVPPQQPANAHASTQANNTDAHQSAPNTLPAQSQTSNSPASSATAQNAGTNGASSTVGNKPQNFKGLKWKLMQQLQQQQEEKQKHSSLEGQQVAAGGADKGATSQDGSGNKHIAAATSTNAPGTTTAATATTATTPTPVPSVPPAPAATNPSGNAAFGQPAGPSKQPKLTQKQLKQQRAAEEAARRKLQAEEAAAARKKAEQERLLQKQQQEQARKLAAEAEAKRIQEEQERRKQEEDAARKKAEQERLAREEAERIAREEAERRAKEEQERKDKEEAERRAREEAERKAREEAERLAQEEADRKAREEEEKRRKEEEERVAREAAERKAREEAEERERKAAEEKARKEKEEKERKAEEARRKKAAAAAARAVKKKEEEAAAAAAAAGASFDDMFDVLPSVVPAVKPQDKEAGKKGRALLQQGKQQAAKQQPHEGAATLQRAPSKTIDEHDYAAATPGPAAGNAHNKAQDGKPVVKSEGGVGAAERSKSEAGPGVGRAGHKRAKDGDDLTPDHQQAVRKEPGATRKDNRNQIDGDERAAPSKRARDNRQHYAHEDDTDDSSDLASSDDDSHERHRPDNSLTASTERVDAGHKKLQHKASKDTGIKAGPGKQPSKKRRVDSSDVDSDDEDHDEDHASNEHKHTLQDKVHDVKSKAADGKDKKVDSKPSAKHEDSSDRAAEHAQQEHSKTGGDAAVAAHTKDKDIMSPTAHDRKGVARTASVVKHDHVSAAGKPQDRAAQGVAKRPSDLGTLAQPDHAAAAATHKGGSAEQRDGNQATKHKSKKAVESESEDEDQEEEIERQKVKSIKDKQQKRKRKVAIVDDEEEDGDEEGERINEHIDTDDKANHKQRGDEDVKAPAKQTKPQKKKLKGPVQGLSAKDNIETARDRGLGTASLVKPEKMHVDDGHTGATHAMQIDGDIQAAPSADTHGHAGIDAAGDDDLVDRVVDCILECSNALAHRGYGPPVMGLPWLPPRPISMPGFPVQQPMIAANNAHEAGCADSVMRAKVDLSKSKSLKEFWAQLSQVFKPDVLPDRLQAQLVYMDGDGDWMLAGDDWATIRSSARKLLIASKL